MRRTQAQLTATAVAALTEALESKGIVVAPGPTTSSLLTSVGAGDAIRMDVVATSVATDEWVRRHLTAKSRNFGAVAVVVADKLPERIRTRLSAAGWSWFDLRGHLRLVGPGLLVDAPVAGMTSSSPRASQPISGQAGVTWAAALLLHPHESPGMRATARASSMSHSAIVAASKRLREASLITEAGRPVIPDLFWALADAWTVDRVGLAALPQLDEGEGYGELGIHADLEEPGWAIAGTAGALAWGAPVFARQSTPPDFYVPSPIALRRAIRRLGRAHGIEDTACTVALPPTHLVCVERVHRPKAALRDWPYAKPLFVALDLALDRTRGLDFLEEWHPKGFDRVW